MKRVNPMKSNFKSLEMEKWNSPKDRAWRVDEKMVSYVHLSCLLPEL